MSELNYSGKRVLIVGGSGGIGNGIAHGFKSRGAEVHIWGTRASAEDYADVSGSDMAGLHYAQVDISDFNALTAYSPPFDSLDILVLCQGVVLYEQQEFEKAGWDKVMNVNINSVMHCANKFKESLAAVKGSLIIVSSIAGFGASVGNPAYAASKAAAVNLTRTLGVAWARDGIRVNGLAPGLVPSKMTSVTTASEKRLQATLRTIPLCRAGTPEEMAGVALFLASPLASYIQGQTIIADGGATLSV